MTRRRADQGVDRADFVVHQAGGQGDLPHHGVAHVRRDPGGALRPGDPQPARRGHVLTQLPQLRLQVGAPRREEHDHVEQRVAVQVRAGLHAGLRGQALREPVRAAQHGHRVTRPEAQFHGQRGARVAARRAGAVHGSNLRHGPREPGPAARNGSPALRRPPSTGNEPAGQSWAVAGEAAACRRDRGWPARRRPGMSRAGSSGAAARPAGGRGYGRTSPGSRRTPPPPRALSRRCRPAARRIAIRCARPGRGRGSAATTPTRRPVTSTPTPGQRTHPGAGGKAHHFAGPQPSLAAIPHGPPSRPESATMTSPRNRHATQGSSGPTAR